MFIFSVKAQNLKLGLSLAVSAIAVALVVTLVPTRGARIESGIPVSPAAEAAARDEKVKDNAARVAFLRALGWEAQEEAREVKEIILPEVFDQTFRKYNELQKAFGYDLEPLKGKTLRRYTYLITNYDYDGEVLADLLIYKDRVVGGDLRSAAANGFLHTLSDTDA